MSLDQMQLSSEVAKPGLFCLSNDFIKIEGFSCVLFVCFVFY